MRPKEAADKKNRVVRQGQSSNGQWLACLQNQAHSHSMSSNQNKEKYRLRVSSSANIRKSRGLKSNLNQKDVTHGGMVID